MCDFSDFLKNIDTNKLLYDTTAKVTLLVDMKERTEISNKELMDICYATIVSYTEAYLRAYHSWLSSQSP